MFQLGSEFKVPETRDRPRQDSELSGAGRSSGVGREPIQKLRELREVGFGHAGAQSAIERGGRAAQSFESSIALPGEGQDVHATVRRIACMSVFSRGSCTASESTMLKMW